MSTSTIDYIFRELAINYLGRNDLAQVTPDDLRSDALQKNEEMSPEDQKVRKEGDEGEITDLDLGVEENTPPTEPLPETAESHPVGGNGNGHGKSNGGTNGGTNSGTSVHALGTVVLANHRTQNGSALAKLKGYEGDPCGECGQLTLVRNGTCLKCLSCGATSGCS
jgi:ribonucleoside-diphosphate reductase alpha chain